MRVERTLPWPSDAASEDPRVRAKAWRDHPALPAWIAFGSVAAGTLALLSLLVP